MDLIEVLERFPDSKACIARLEKIRWADIPHCGSADVVRKRESDVRAYR